MAILSAADAAALLSVEATDATLLALLGPAQRALESFIGWEVEQASYIRFYPKVERGGASSPFVHDWGGRTNSNRSRTLGLDHKWVRPSGLEVREKTAAYAGQAEDFDGDTVLTLGSDYVLDLDQPDFSRSGQLIRLNSNWPRQRHSVKATYTAGFTAAELAGTDSTYDASDIRGAMIQTITLWYQQAKANEKSRGTVGPIISENIQGYSYVKGMTLVRDMAGLRNSLPPIAMQMVAKYRRYTIPV